MLVQGQQTPPAKNAFDPPELTTAADISYPYNSVAWGLVVLEVSLDASGNVIDVSPIHAIPSLTEPSIKSIRTWKFHPATLDNKPVPSRTLVAVMFDSGNGPGQNPSTPHAPEEPTAGAPPPDHLVEVVSPANAIQGWTAAGPGSVVLKAKVTAESSIESLIVVRDSPPYTHAAMQALPKWEFKPAQFGGKSVFSYVAVAFVFRPPYVNNR